jgi:hypothetical protein
MKKKLFILTFLTLFFFSFYSPVYAESSSESSSFWQKIINIFLSNFVTSQKIDINRTEIATEYSNDPNYSGDITTRIVPESARTQKKLQYITGVIKGEYDNQSLGECPESDKPVTVLNLAHYLNSQNILYLNQLDQDKLEQEPSPSVFNQACYKKLFEELHIIPPEEKKQNAKTYILNETIRNIIPDKSQTTDLSQVKNIKEDTAHQTENMYNQIIPNNSQNSNEKLKDQFSSWLQPDSWQN